MKHPLVRTIGELAAASHDLARQAEQEYAREVDAVIEKQCRDSEHIERLESDEDRTG